MAKRGLLIKWKQNGVVPKFGIAFYNDQTKELSEKGKAVITITDEKFKTEGEPVKVIKDIRECKISGFVD